MTLLQQRRVVVTGLGAISNLGHDVSATWDGLLAGHSGVGPITAFEQDDRWVTTIAGEVKDWEPADKLDRSEQVFDQYDIPEAPEKFHASTLMPFRWSVIRNCSLLVF